MMLFKLSFRNMKKSFKDYAIYFLTLVLGVAIFYMFNSIDSQQAMLDISESKKQIIKLMIQMLGMVSVFIAVILGLLIVYANKFLINRRKKEFGIYMTLGMGKRQISKIILFETILVGIISLFAGLAFGVFASQFMSVLVAKIFEANMDKFTFIFSKDACIKTCVYFAIMYFVVMIFNTITISRYKLINLLTATKKNEKVKIKNPILSVLLFIIACIILGWAYWKVTVNLKALKEIPMPIIAGIIGTVLVFWSASGFVLKVVQMNKKVYLKNTNMFVLRQLNNKINTTVISMSVICLMLFMTITILSTSLALQNTMKKDLLEMTPVDINLYKPANIEDTYLVYGNPQKATEQQKKDSYIPVTETLKNNGYDVKNLKDIVEFAIYGTDELTVEKFLQNSMDEVREKYPLLDTESIEEIVKISDYNKIAKLYGHQEYSLNDDEYMVLCDFDGMKQVRDLALKKEATITLNGKNYKAKYNECKPGYVYMSTSHANLGIILVPDSCDLKESWKKTQFLAANYNANTDEEKAQMEKMFISDNSSLVQKLNSEGTTLDGQTKISIIEASVGVSTIVVFIAIYLGITFLIASSAILALKQLTESSDNKQRYSILRKIGCDEKMINRALFKQIAIFFMLPLVVAMVHSIFGIQFALYCMSALASKEQLLPSVTSTILIMGAIYGIYFIFTYVESKNIIKEEL